MNRYFPKGELIMIQRRANPSLRIGIVLAAALAVFLSKSPASACQSANLIIENLGAAEEGGAPSSFITGVQNVNCSSFTISNITSNNSDSTDFIVSDPPQGFTPSCLPSHTVPAGSSCYFLVVFAPTGTGNFSTVINPTFSNGTMSPFYFWGAGFTLSPATGPEQHVQKLNGNTFDAFPLFYESPPSSGFASITFDPGNAEIKWEPNLTYQSSGKDPSPSPISTPSIDQFTTNQASKSIGFGTPGAEATPDAPYVIAGGQLSLKSVYSPVPVASPSPIGNNPAINHINVYLTGIPSSQSSPGIPYTAITSQVNKLYQQVTLPSPAPTGAITAGLMTQLVKYESGVYQQFLNPPGTYHNATFPFNGVVASWPLESAPTKVKKGARTIRSPAGGHIGLFQLPINGKPGTTGTSGQADAWDWIQNTMDGVLNGSNSFQAKLNMANSNVGKMQTGLTPTFSAGLTACQLEEMALELYGPHAGGTKPLLQYYIPFCSGKPQQKGQTTCSGGSWQWGINETPANICGVCYVVFVRNSIPPSGSTSSCISTDPPTGLSCSGC